jgi:hypothetical protein
VACGGRPAVFDPDYGDVIPDSLGVQMIAATCDATNSFDSSLRLSALAVR